MTKFSGTCLHTIRAGILFISTLFLMSCATVASSNSYQATISPEGFQGNEFMKLRLQGSLAISGARVKGLPVVELSDLAWDADANTLYAISDDGYLYQMKLSIRENRLVKADIINATRLKGANKRALKGAANDPEGLSIRRASNGNPTDAELLISFEGKSRVNRYDLAGNYLGDVALPKHLLNRHNYRHGNKMLESVAIHPKHGVIVAAELPLKSNPVQQQSVYAQNGKVWNFPRFEAPESSITALESLPNGDVLVLERAWSGLFSPLVISLRQLQVNRCDNTQQCSVKDLAVFSTGDGWNVDNFEGLTHLSGNQYLMVSDDNKSPLQQSLLVLFEILP